VKIKEYFSDSELSCKCGCGMKPDKKAVELLYAMRIILGAPMVITSAARCEAHNQHVGGVEHSFHIQELDRHGIGAFDIAMNDGISISKYIEAAKRAGFTALGINEKKNFVHVDNRPLDGYQNFHVWIY
jgi:hypothetical protein